MRVLSKVLTIVGIATSTVLVHASNNVKQTTANKAMPNYLSKQGNDRVTTGASEYLESCNEDHTDEKYRNRILAEAMRCCAGSPPSSCP